LPTASSILPHPAPDLGLDPSAEAPIPDLPPAEEQTDEKKADEQKADEEKKDNEQKVGEDEHVDKIEL
jgi:hypothetical protein